MLLDTLSGIIIPFLIIMSGTYFSVLIKMPKILLPNNFLKTIKEGSSKSGVSPFKALSTALAGTLGVGNITGVATAIYSGGTGAVFWMWIGAVFSMSIKYCEVSLAVKYRQPQKDCYTGGTMYSMKYGLSRYIGRISAVLGGLFASLCIINSLVTGTLIQVNSAASTFPFMPKAVIGIILGILTLSVSIKGNGKIMDFTYSLIPLLSLVYSVLSCTVIIINIKLMPNVIKSILFDAFSFKSAAGGIGGFSVNQAIRFGITRGIFSNEAGSGTSPSAHATADCISPHHQGVLGIFEVIADTVILCSMTAFVILIADFKGVSHGYGIELALSSFEGLLGTIPKNIIALSVILFAFATLLAQQLYINTAICYFTKSKTPIYFIMLLTFVFSIVGSISYSPLIWEIADTVICTMTLINILFLLFMSREIKSVNRKYFNKRKPHG